MTGQVGGPQVSREELRARGRYSLTIACLFVLILLGAGLPLPRRAIVVVPIVVAIVVSIREMRRLSRASAGAFTRFGPAVALGLSTVLLLGAVTQAVADRGQEVGEEAQPVLEAAAVGVGALVVAGLRKSEMRSPWLASSSMPSKPASPKRRAALPASSTISSISATGMARGMVWNRWSGTTEGA